MANSIPRFAAFTLLALTAAASVSCEGPKKIRRHFDAPAGIAIAPAGDDLPAHLFGFVVDVGNFAVRRIDLTSRKIVEPRLPVGRQLGALAAHTGASGTVDELWGLDRLSGELISIDPAVALLPVAGPVSFADAGPASGVELVDVVVVEGRTATQTWTATYRDSLDRWEVRGNSIGTQKKLAETGKRYVSDDKEVAFSIRETAGVATEGDRFTFDTNNGVAPVAVAGSAQAMNLLRYSNDVGVVATREPGSLVAFDLGTGLPIASFGLPAGASPGGMDLTPDSSAIYVADLGNPLVYRLNTVGLPATWTLESLPVQVPMRDLAVNGDGSRLFTMASGADDVFVNVLPLMEPVDFVGIDAAIDPVSFQSDTSGIRAIGAARRTHVMKGSGVPSYPLMVSTHKGDVITLNGSTGCMDFADSRGARFTGVRFRDSAVPSGPRFLGDSFGANRCGGIVRSETWTLIYNGLIDAWEVEGALSGRQSRPMPENVDYTTDRGEITVHIVSDATLPTDDGDAFVLTVVDGITPLAVGLVPERPVFFTITKDGVETEFALVTNSASDSVSQIDVGRRRVTATYR